MYLIIVSAIFDRCSICIHVARLAGMPPQVLNRASAMLEMLEEKNARSTEGGRKGSKKGGNGSPKDDLAGCQLSFIQLDDPTLLEIKDKILDIDIDTLTPLEALLKLNEIKKIVSNR